MLISSGTSDTSFFQEAPEKARKTTKEADKSAGSQIQPPAPETSTTRNYTAYLALIFILNFSAGSYAPPPFLKQQCLCAPPCMRTTARARVPFSFCVVLGLPLHDFHSHACLICK